MEQAVAKLISELDRTPEETLAQSALRFVFAQPFLDCALIGMFLPEELEENYHAWQAYNAPCASATGRPVPCGRRSGRALPAGMAPLSLRMAG